MPATLMSLAEKNTSNEKNQSQIKEIHNLVEKGRLKRDEHLGTSNVLFEKAFELAEEIQYHSGKGISLRELSVNYLQARLYKQAVKALDESAKYFAEDKDLLTNRKCLNELSDIYFTLGDYELCLETLLISLQVSKDLNDRFLIGEIYNKIGNVYKVIGEYQKAIEQHLHALELFEQTGDQAQISISNYNIGNCYNWADELDVAYNFLEKSLKLANQLRDTTLKINPLGSLAILFTKSKNYHKAEEYFFMALEAVEKAGSQKLKADLLKSLGNLYCEQKLFSKAIATLQEALQITDKLELKNPANLIHLFLSNAFEKTGDYNQALQHLKKYKDITREITNEEIAIKTKGVQLKFDLEEAKKQKELAEHSARLKDKFLSGISHELRTPLNGVLGMANLLADTHPSPEQLEYINTIKLSANNLIAIIDDILDYSKIKAGEIVLSEEQINLIDLISSIAQTIKSKADQKQLDFTLKIQPEVPAIIVGDKSRLSQVLMNLLSNAVKFTDKGTVTFEVGCKNKMNGVANLYFVISDSGVGITEAKMRVLFDSFARETADENQFTEGTGLGLAIVKQLVDLLNGKITASSRLNTGSVFTVELNYKYTDEANLAGIADYDVPLRNLSDVSLLLVEDNKVNQFLGKQILSKLGFKVKIAGNGREALEILNTNDFDLILMDVNMPVMNGYDLTQVIRNQVSSPKNKIPIVALTAYASSNEKEKALSLGMNDYVTKPYTPEDLLHVIVKQLNLKTPGSQEPEKITKTANTSKEPASFSDVLVRLRLVLNGSEDDLRKMLEMYCEQIPAINKQIKLAISFRNWEEVYQQAHKLKSSVKLLGISRMSELITMIEEYAKIRENTELISPLFEAFVKECQWVLAGMKEALK